jgi:hypothetical protein
MFEVLKVIEWNEIINILFIINVIDFRIWNYKWQSKYESKLE